MGNEIKDIRLSAILDDEDNVQFVDVHTGRRLGKLFGYEIQGEVNNVRTATLRVHLCDKDGDTKREWR